jgi:hypothetical protein
MNSDLEYTRKILRSNIEIAKRKRKCFLLAVITINILIGIGIIVLSYYLIKQELLLFKN